jgi:hypothetical protein
MNVKSFFKKARSIIMLIAVLGMTGMLALFALPSQTVWANTLPVAVPPVQKVDIVQNRVLQNQFKREQIWLASQQIVLNTADLAAKRVQNLINQARNEGKNVAELQTGLDVFNAQLASALAAHNTAAFIISTRSGFNAGGMVINREAAHRNVLDARQSLWSAHQTIFQAVRDFDRVVRDWFRDHKSSAVLLKINADFSPLIDKMNLRLNTTDTLQDVK